MGERNASLCRAAAAGLYLLNQKQGGKLFVFRTYKGLKATRLPWRERAAFRRKLKDLGMRARHAIHRGIKQKLLKAKLEGKAPPLKKGKK